jgi:hypothetical protein
MAVSTLGQHVSGFATAGRAFGMGHSVGALING